MVEQRQTITLELHGHIVVRTQRGPRHSKKEPLNEAASQTAFQAQLDADQLLAVLALGRCRGSLGLVVTKLTNLSIVLRLIVHSKLLWYQYDGWYLTHISGS